MSDISKKIPSPEEVRQIFKDTYNLYLKYHTITDLEQWVPLMQEMREIDSRYSCELCRSILMELVVVIQDEFLQRQGGTDENIT